jgi:glycosyltransferase involved in cell wall biosynthesis
MRVTCLIDNLGAGGAQRQMCMLAVLLKNQGLDVSMLTYHQNDFFRPTLEAAGIEAHCISQQSKFRRALTLRHLLRSGRQDVVLAFLDGPCMYAELAALPRRRWGLVVSERLAVPGSDKRRLPWRQWFHHLADYVTTNSHTNRLMIERTAPRLIGRVVTVYNAVDLDHFRPATVQGTRPANALNLAVLASFQAKKNLRGLVEAVAVVRSRMPALEVAVDWYGGSPQRTDGTPETRVRDEGQALIDRHGLQERFRLHAPNPNAVQLYQEADALVLPSFFEGLPNVVCEAMACGRPVLCSAVCEAGNLVKPGQNGFLFDPANAEDMARAILDLAALGPAERVILGQNGRQRAELLFAPKRFAAHYVGILEAAAARECRPIQHWVPEVPATAY